MKYSTSSRQELLDRIAELESAHLALDVDPLFQSLPFALTPTQRTILRMLYKADGRYLTTDYFCDTIGAGKPEWVASLKVQMNRLRNALPEGISITVTYGRGYRLGPNSRLALEALTNAPEADGIPSGLRPVTRAGTSYRNPLRPIGPRRTPTYD